MSKFVTIKKGYAADVRFPLRGGAGSDSMHSNPTYAYSVCKLETDQGFEGIGLAFTLGAGNDIVCKAITYLSESLAGKEINELMSDFGATYRALIDHPGFRWLGPHKGVIHLATAAIVNACFDLWAKTRGVPLWKLLLDLSPEEVINTLDFSYYEDILTREEALGLMNDNLSGVEKRKQILNTGYPGYDTSIGWFNYSDESISTNVKSAMDRGFTAMKLKVGSSDPDRDIRRAILLRKTAGEKATIMFDANQKWSLPLAIDVCKQLNSLNPFWIEEPTHPDDIQAHVRLSREVPVKLALGEHVPNKMIFKNYIQSGCMSYNQVDAVRVGGISEFILISLLSKKFQIPVVPHVGDMGQIHQHLVLFNHIAMNHEVIFLEHIPHLRGYFKWPVEIVDGRYKVPQQEGASSDLKHY